MHFDEFMRVFTPLVCGFALMVIVVAAVLHVWVRRLKVSPFIQPQSRVVYGLLAGIRRELRYVIFVTAMALSVGAVTALANRRYLWAMVAFLLAWGQVIIVGTRVRKRHIQRHKAIAEGRFTSVDRFVNAIIVFMCAKEGDGSLTADCTGSDTLHIECGDGVWDLKCDGFSAEEALLRLHAALRPAARSARPTRVILAEAPVPGGVEVESTIIMEYPDRRH